MPKITGKHKTAHASNGSVPAAKTPEKEWNSGDLADAMSGYPRKAKPAKAPLESSPKKPLWGGPEVDGITYSLLSRFLSCRERFRLLVVEGLKEKEGFQLRIEYGKMIHVCEEATAAKKDWQPALLEYVKKLVKKFGNSESQSIDHWYKVCCVQYPIYLDHWKKHPDVKNRKPVFQEKPFDIPYRLPSGRTVRLRGKYDAGDLIANKLYIQENKARGDIQPDKMLSELPMDLQTNIYLTAANEEFKSWKSYPLGGCRYNVVRRPLSGGKFSIKQHEGRGKDKKGAETEAEFLSRLRGLIRDNAEHFFFRWKIEVTKYDITSFQGKTLNPVLEQLWDWWEWISQNPFDPWNLGKPAWVNRIHWMYPTGVYNPTAEGRSSAYDEYIMTGSDRGLLKTKTLYPELEELNA